ncbi:PRP38-domain-containing protein [Calocera viscosa TUFC12733]|uniref:Pre-mRNA-splicing factor 38 n=1 Tax=Calocera viscosa (strain TUFC12733) TaxID=1330018 RepID=A0A167R152_CALVF|nr:PRP38-domain-containing protein [Calocera viscosa TUFC12733]
MANTTVRGATSVHGTNPQYLIETVIRSRIYESLFWKEQCFALTAETLIDKAIELNCIGGVYGNQRPTHFMCLLLKLLQIQPEKEILIEYLLVDEFKYLRALAAIYIRLVFRPAEVFELLEPLLKDYRKIRLRNTSGYRLTYMDEYVDELLREERVCDIILPRMTKREVLEEVEGLAPRASLLLDAMKAESDSDSDRGRGHVRSRNGDGDVRMNGGSSRSASVKSGERSPSEGRFVSRSPTRSPASPGQFRSRTPSMSPDRD